MKDEGGRMKWGEEGECRKWEGDSEKGKEGEDSRQLDVGSRKVEGEIEESVMATENELVKRAPKRAAKRAMAEALNALKKIGAGATGLFAKLKGNRSPDEMLDTLDTQAASNLRRRKEVSQTAETLHKEIVRKKRERDGASPARKRLLDLELKNMLHEYKSLERQLTVFLENERVISSVKGRFMEALTYELRGVQEDQVEDLTEMLDERADEAEEVLDALGDLEKAGRRRDRDAGDELDLDEELAAFDSDELEALEAETDSGEIDDEQSEDDTEDRRDSQVPEPS